MLSSHECHWNDGSGDRDPHGAGGGEASMAFSEVPVEHWRAKIAANVQEIGDGIPASNGRLLVHVDRRVRRGRRDNSVEMRKEGW
ncbi:hypothetical protein SERLA73DRAFT_180661 [Serpula lacrymans var. lacrymans S7.3]|uniref:Uncharacterized protein n=1 Tax=Serpula lacrymans var. lacrymans (strain S7.3) TaxID=936435 RepID=F8PVR5_SERL3|nr:hypothetical protein SERLA73DRAFT_180661 [Serpula lacrymans var. lacrymans S7.3]